MIKARLFVGLVALAVLTVVALGQVRPDRDYFCCISAQSPLFFDNLTPSEIADLKVRHALAAPRYDVGLFGTSRNANVTAESLGLASGRFFNFAVPGGVSIRWNILLLERLRDAGKAPRLAVVMLDHLELQAYGNPKLDAPVTRWRNAAAEVWTGIRDPEIPLREVLRMGWRYLFQEYQQFKQSFSFDLFRRRAGNLIRCALGLDPQYGRPAAPEEQGYSADGSRAMVPHGGGQPAVIPPGPPSFMPGYLSHDLRRLKRLERDGTRVIVYESFLHPASARHYRDHPSGAAADIRRRFLTDCRRIGLECHAAPFPDWAYEEGPPWLDATHPPAAFQARYLRPLIEDGLRMAGIPAR